MKKKLILVFVVLLVAVIALPVLASCTPREDTLRVYSWEEYIHNDFINENETVNGFKAYYKSVTGKNIKIKYETFTENEDIYTKLAVRKADYDVICPSDYMIERLVANDLIERLWDGDELEEKVVEELNKRLEEGETLPEREQAVSNRGNISQYILDQTSYLDGYYAPYMWGTMGILYNLDLLHPNHQTLESDGHPAFVKSWKALFDPDEKAYYEENGGRIWMKVNMRDSFAIGSVWAMTQKDQANELSYSQKLNVKDELNIKAIGDVLKAQKSVRKGFESETAKPELALGGKNSAAMSLQWSGDAVYAMAEGASLVDSKGRAKEEPSAPNLNYYVPEEGSNIWFDGWCIPKTNRNRLGAELWINYMCDPAAAIKNMEYIGYTSAIATQDVIDWCNKTYADNGEKVDLSYFFVGLDSAYSMYADEVQFPSLEVIKRCAIMKDYGDAEILVNREWSSVRANG